jgi:hypothetical protein
LIADLAGSSRLALRKLDFLTVVCSRWCAACCGVLQICDCIIEPVSLQLVLMETELAMQGLPLDAESIAAAIVADAVHDGRLPLEAVEERLGPICALLIHDILKVHSHISTCPFLLNVLTAQQLAPLYRGDSSSACRYGRCQSGAMCTMMWRLERCESCAFTSTTRAR